MYIKKDSNECTSYLRKEFPGLGKFGYFRTVRDRYVSCLDNLDYITSYPMRWHKPLLSVGLTEITSINTTQLPHERSNLRIWKGNDEIDKLLYNLIVFVSKIS